MPGRERSLAALLEVRQAVSAPFSRRVLTPDLVENLIGEWNLHTRGGKDQRALREIGELHVYLGWTEHELAEWRMKYEAPVEEPQPAGRHRRWLRVVTS